MQTAKFRKDDGTTIKLPLSIALERQEIGGFLTLDDGEVVRRIFDPAPPKEPKPVQDLPHRPEVSDACGFIGKQLAEMEDHRRHNGFTGVEFREDPKVPGFYQTVFNCSDKERKRYFEQRQVPGEHASVNTGFRLTQEDLDKAKELVSR
jgi:hypothetical protein